MQGKGTVVMVRKLRIRTLSNWSFMITVLLALLCIASSAFGVQKYEELSAASQDYIACEAAAHELQAGSDTLTSRCGWPRRRESSNTSTPTLKKPM